MEILMKMLRKCYEEQISADKDVTKAIYLYNNKRPHLSIQMMMPVYMHQNAVKVKNLWKKQEQKKTTMYNRYRKCFGNSTLSATAQFRRILNMTDR